MTGLPPPILTVTGSGKCWMPYNVAFPLFIFYKGETSEQNRILYEGLPFERKAL